MALTSQLNIETQSGDGDTDVAIDPAFWAANETTIEGYAAAAGVTLYYQDHLTSATSVSANVNTLADAQYQINHAAQLTAGATGPTSSRAAAPPAAADDSTGTVLAMLAVVAIAAVAVLASSGRAALEPRRSRALEPRRELGPRWAVVDRGRLIGHVEKLADGSWQVQPSPRSPLSRARTTRKLADAATELHQEGA